jgi:stearoyl-CoA desaturase (delta-9 desaturase)
MRIVARFQQLQRQLENRRHKISWGTPLDDLPAISIAQYIDYVGNGRSLIIINGIVYDVSNFIDDHPGGATQLQTNIGKDCTKLFHGGVYAHSNAAINLLSTMQIALIADNPCQLQTTKAHSGYTDSD